MKLAQSWESFKKNVRAFYVDDSQGKPVWRKKTIAWTAVCLVFFGMAAPYISMDKDSSVVHNSTEPIKFQGQDVPVPNSEASGKVGEMISNSERKERGRQKAQGQAPRGRLVRNIEYKAPQVIARKDSDGTTAGLPVGTNLIGKLLTSVDTREPKQMYKVLLPYGGRDKNGGEIPKNSVLFGTIRYPGNGNKVFFQFSNALLPNGKEVEIKAQALSSKDYSPGLIGEYHGKGMERVAATLGLSMVSAMSDTLTEREALGQGGIGSVAEATPKATAKNALYQGLSRVSEMEAARQADRLAREPEYVTIDAGQEMIVNLTATYREAH